MLKLRNEERAAKGLKKVGSWQLAATAHKPLSLLSLPPAALLSCKAMRWGCADLRPLCASGLRVLWADEMALLCRLLTLRPCALSNCLPADALMAASEHTGAPPCVWVGACAVDAATGQMLVGQWLDDELRSLGRGRKHGLWAIC